MKKITMWVIGGIIGMLVAAIAAILIYHVSTQINKNKIATIESDFLNFVPADETGSPHTLEWLIEKQTGNLGYYSTSHLPGQFHVTAFKNPTSSRYYDVTWIVPDSIAVHPSLLYFNFSVNQAGTFIHAENKVSSVMLYLINNNMIQ